MASVGMGERPAGGFVEKKGCSWVRIDTFFHAKRGWVVAMRVPEPERRMASVGMGERLAGGCVEEKG